MKFWLGIDAGSSYTKLVLVDSSQKPVARQIAPRGSNIEASCRDCMDQLLRDSGINLDQIEGIASTGYGRKQVSFANKAITEVTALSIGAFCLDQAIRTIIDVGGQDSKVIGLDESGNVVDFALNSKCAAGTGKFLEVTSASLGLALENLTILAKQADKSLCLSSTCTVFAESEIISHLAAGEKKENIIKALHTAVSSQILGLFHQVCSRSDGKILFTGGVALNEGIVSELQHRLNRDILVSESPQYVGAFGVAIYLKRLYEKGSH